MALVGKGGATLAVVEEFQGYKARLDRIAAELKVLRDNAQDRKENLGREVQEAREGGQRLGLLAGVVVGAMFGPVVGVGVGMAAGALAVRHNVENVYECDRRYDREDKAQMRELLWEFQEKVKTMRLALKYLKKYFQLHHMDPEGLLKMEHMINQLIEDIDMASSLRSLQSVSQQCKRVMNKLEETLEDVKVELYFASQALN